MAKKRNGVSQSNRRMASRPISVFISYSRDDAKIAAALKAAIGSIDNKFFRVFLDVETIELGKNWKTEIAKNVKRSDVFIAIFTGDQKHVFDYCGFEVGLFSGYSGKRKNTMFCIYDTREPPTILADLEGVRITYLGDRDPVLATDDGWAPEKYSPRMKEVFQLCYKLYEKRNRMRLADESEAKARKIIQAFYSNKGDDLLDEKPLQERLVVILPSADDWKSAKAIPPAALVAAESSSFNLIGIPTGLLQTNEDKSYYTTWVEFVKILETRAGNVVPWIHYVEGSILSQLSIGTYQPPQLNFMGTDGKVYRPILSRYKQFRSGRWFFYVQIIPTLEKSFIGKDETSVPLIGLIFAARFYFKFYEDRDMLAQAFSDEKTDNEFDLEIRSLDSYLQRMITEGSEYGLSDKEAIKRVLALPPDESTLIDHFFSIWQQAYGELSNMMKGRLNGGYRQRQDVRDSLRTFSDQVGPSNSRFMKMMFDKLLAKLPPVSGRQGAPMQAELMEPVPRPAASGVRQRPE